MEKTYNEGKKHLGWSSPAKPALITPEPYTNGNHGIGVSNGIIGAYDAQMMYRHQSVRNDSLPFDIKELFAKHKAGLHCQ